MPARKQIIVLMTLWGRVCPLRDAKESKYERLRWLARQTGRIVDSANELTDDELERCIETLRRETRPSGHGFSRAGKRREGSFRSAEGHKVRQFPNRSGITKEQLWKVRQLEHYLGWAGRPQRLEGLLRSRFQASRPQDLTHAQAWRLIEMLFSIAAREELRREGHAQAGEQGQDSGLFRSAEGDPQGHPEKRSDEGPARRKRRPADSALAAARARLKELLQTWRPPGEPFAHERRL